MVNHVNAVKGFRYAPYRGQSIRNCAACTAAGAVNLTIGRSQYTSAIVARTMGTGDNVKTMGENTEKQAVNIRNYVCDLTGRESVMTDSETPLDEATSWMLGMPDKTVFAVLADGNVPYDNEVKCHWLNAILAGGVISYFDFQPMRKSSKGGDFIGHANPATSTKPFVGVITQSQNSASNRHMHSASQVGVFADTVKLTVIAFLAN